MHIYLDYNATAPIRPEVAARMAELLALPMNASSVHAYGREAKKQLENARRTIAEAISAFPAEIIFTASGSEANAMALSGFPGRRVLASAVEHSSVLAATPKDRLIPVDANGVVDLPALDAMLAHPLHHFSHPHPNPPPQAGEGTMVSPPHAGEGIIVSVMLANNETGVIQPVAEVAALCKKYGALLHCDAVQGLGKIPVDFSLLGADMLTVTAHKCGGPVGVGALVLRQNLAIAPMIKGGGQELGRRAGTENIAAIAGFAKAVELFDFGHMAKLRGWLDAMENFILNEVKDLSKDASALPQHDKILFGGGAERLPNTSCIAMQGVSSEVQLMDFDLKGFAISAGSACSSGRIEPSHVLSAMKIPENVAKCAIRISAGWKTTEKEIMSFTEAWKTTYNRLAGSS